MSAPSGTDACSFLGQVLPESGYSTLCAINPKKRDDCRGRSVSRDTLSDPALACWLEEHQDFNLYFTPNTVARVLNKKPIKDDISVFRWVHLDLDPPDKSVPSEEWQTATLERLRAYRLPPSVVVFSGGGYQAFWLLRDPVKVNGNIEQLEAANKRVIADLGGDTGTHNLDRVMRLPGTTNWPTATKKKRGRVPVEARLLEVHLDRTYDFDEFTNPEARDEPVDRSRDLLKKVGADKRAGLNNDEVHQRHAAHPHARDQADPARAVQRCIDRVCKAPHDLPTAETLTLDEMVTYWVHIARGPLLVDSDNPRRKLRPGEWHAYYAHCKTAINSRGGQTSVSTTRLCAEDPRRACADDLGFDPSHGRFYRHDGKVLFNQLRLPEWPRPTGPDYASDLALGFFEHLEFLVPDQRERDDLLDWLAAIVQQPGTRPHRHFVLVATRQGMGRSWIGEVFRRLLTEHHAAEVDLHSLLEDAFNSMLSCKLLVTVHEVKAPPNERYQHKERLKSLLTDTQLVVNEKHLPRWTEKNVARFLMFTNRTDALPLSENDRRLYVVRCSDTPRDTAYYTKLYRLLDDADFLAAVWWALAERDLSNYNPGLIAPLTEAKLAMAEAGRTLEQQRAVDFVKTAPFDVIAGSDLARTLTPRDENEPRKEQQQRHASVLAVLREVGVQSHPKKLWLPKNDGGGNEPARVWVLRNPDRWRNAGGALFRQAVEQTRQLLVKHHYNADNLLALWMPRDEDDTPPDSGAGRRSPGAESDL